MIGEFRLGDIHIEGRSWAGDETWFRVHPPGVAFDVGRGTQQLAGCADIFLSHGHLDHALGVPFVLSQRTLHHSAATRVFCPSLLAAPLDALIAAAAVMEGVEYDYQVVPLRPGDRVELRKNMVVEAFATDHVVPSLGYHLLQLKRRLVSELRGAGPAELVALKKEGKSIEEIEERIWLSYLGDTGAGIFDAEPDLFNSRVLLMECTFLEPGRADKGKLYGHMHLEDLVALEDRFQNEAVVLHHLSRRHHEEDLAAAVARDLPLLAPRIHFLLGSR